MRGRASVASGRAFFHRLSLLPYFLLQNLRLVPAVAFSYIYSVGVIMRLRRPRRLACVRPQGSPRFLRGCGGVAPSRVLRL